MSERSVNLNLQAYLEKKRDSAMQELAELNKQLGYDERISALCPSCKARFNMRTVPSTPARGVDAVQRMVDVALATKQSPAVSRQPSD